MLNVDCSILRDCMPKKKYAQEVHNLYREYNNYFIIAFRYRILYFFRLTKHSFINYNS